MAKFNRRYYRCKYGILVDVPEIRFGMIFPKFFHNFKRYGENGETANFSLNPMNHRYKGSFNRHLAVDRALHLLRVISTFHMKHGILNDYVQSVTGVFFGLNCGFPLKDVACYTLWFTGLKRPYTMKGKGARYFFLTNDQDKLVNLAKEEPEKLRDLINWLIENYDETKITEEVIF